LFAFLFLCLVCGFMLHHGADEESEATTGGLVRKGTANSRADLWESRIAEFKSSPLLGIGVAMGTGSGSAVEEDGTVRVEPGSSYLAVPAMTGALGTVSFGVALGMLLCGFAFARQKPTLDRDILNVVGVFLAIHGVAEGWVLAFGSPLGLIFWLWLGSVGDATLAPSRAIARRRLPTRQIFPSRRPALRPAATGL
jgi:O-antigen ligase